MAFNCLKAKEPLRGDSLLFPTQPPDAPSTHLMDLGRMSLPWSHPTSLNPRHLYWESSALTTAIIGKMYVKCS